MSEATILVIEDEADLQELVRVNLEREGYRVLTAGRGDDGLRAVRRERPQLVLLDLMLPGMNGLEVCRLLKGDAGTRDIPVVMLSAKSEEPDVVAGLELGADDYIPKPFSPRVLVARVRAVLRRSQPTEPGLEQDSGAEVGLGESGVGTPSIPNSSTPKASAAPVQIHGLTIDLGRHEVRTESETLELTVSEFRLLLTLARRPGWVLTRQQIMDAVHGADYHVTERAIDVHVVGLRKKLGSSGALIETVRGVGYRMRE